MTIEFQFLIGRLGTAGDCAADAGGGWFQFLIGRLGTYIAYTIDRKGKGVSIPHR